MKNYNLAIFGGISLLGLLVLIFPTFWINLVVFIVGLGAVAYGLYNLLVTKRVFQDSMYETVILVKSVFSIVIGSISVILPLAVADAMWKTMIYVLIVYLLLAAIIGFYSVSLLKSTEIDRKRFVLENLSLLLLAVALIIISPERLGIFIVRLIGLAAFILGIFMITITLMSQKNVVDAEVVEVREGEEGSTDSEEE
ncbi:hypothetical protein MSI_14250 [Treponema sp. JC4]|uniref:hypothetical protein n=1 Tax=Treponema sp. JC4 TaxID=1124982 RepID=UPI00025AFD57|nr:hypothetical protein [Treponema sp. JC4]EID85039.1 hypothetical protein MSI_14250 [Treponema sp. JC4]